VVQFPHPPKILKNHIIKSNLCAFRNVKTTQLQLWSILETMFKYLDLSMVSFLQHTFQYCRSVPFYVYIELKGIPFWYCSYGKTKQLSTESIIPLEIGIHRSEICTIYSMCLYRQQCTADQTSTSEKHVYIKAVFRYRVTSWHHACMRFLRSQDLALWDPTSMMLWQVGTLGEFGSLFGHL
jgi:hypothetical protein